MSEDEKLFGQSTTIFPEWKKNVIQAIKIFDEERQKCNKEISEDLESEKIIACRVSNTGTLEKSLENLGEQLMEFSDASVTFERKTIDSLRMCLKLSTIFYEEKVDPK